MTKKYIITQLPVKYEIVSVDELFTVRNTYLKDYCKSGRSLVVVDKKVNDLYPNIEQWFNYNGIEAKFVIIDGVEEKKNLGSLYEILFQMEQFGISRNAEPVLAIGGGVIQDLVGMACSMYRRGVPYVRIPTTLIGIVDVSVAAKTGINFENRRNRLGSYYPPIASILDKSFLKTLDPIEISSGMGEILKMGVIKDDSLMDCLIVAGEYLCQTKLQLSENNDIASLVINLAIDGMIDELENNLWEKNLKRCVDFGHSFSPIIEMRSLSTDKPLTHGQAVTLDIILSCCIASNRGLMSAEDRDCVVRTAKSLGLETWHESFANPELLLEALQDTTKHRGGDQNLPMPTQLGQHTFINDLTYEEICKAVKTFNEIDEQKI